MISRRAESIALMGFAVAALVGCGPQTIVPAVRSGSESPAKIDWSDWALTLSRCVRDERVDYRNLQSEGPSLDRFLLLVSRVGPETTPDQFPDRDARLAYFINCYNATIVRSVLALARKDLLPTRVPFDFEHRYRFGIDGQLRMPADLRKLVMDSAGDDWRVRLTLCDGTLEGPPLWRRVYLPEMLDAQLNFVVKSMLVSTEVVQIKHGYPERLLLWRGLSEIQDSLIRDYERQYSTTHATILNVLGHWSNRTRREELNSAIGYPVEPMPHDDRINHFEPPPDNGGFLSIFSSLPGA